MALEPPPNQIARQVALALGPQFWTRWATSVVSGWQQVPMAVPTSWWRSPELNAAVGGHPRSQHLWGLAIDFAVPGRDQANDLVRTFRGLGFTVVLETDHVHVQTFPPGIVS